MKLLILFDYVFNDRDIEFENRIKGIMPDIEIVRVSDQQSQLPEFADADIIYGWPRPSSSLSIAKSLKWLHLPSAGAGEYMDKTIYANPDAIVTKSKGTYGLPISEYVIGIILAWNFHLPWYVKKQNRNDWGRRVDRKDIYGSTFGILGLGNIGTEIAIRAKAMGARVIATKRTMYDEKPDYVDELMGEDGTDKLLKQSDYVISTLPSSPANIHMLDYKRFELMKNTAMFINIGRGNTVVQDDMIKALQNGEIAGAALDVTDPEPLPADSPLWSMENVIITPHMSGVSPSNHKMRNDIFLKLLKQYTGDGIEENLVDYEAGY